jgi:YD repeat-containing protein
MSQFQGLNFTYDGFNRLIGVTGTNAQGDGVSVEYAYDAFGRRVLSTSGGSGTLYVHSGDQVVEERSTGGTLLRQYVWGQYVDELVQQREYARAPMGATSIGSFQRSTKYTMDYIRKAWRY